MGNYIGVSLPVSGQYPRKYTSEWTGSTEIYIWEWPVSNNVWLLSVCSTKYMTAASLFNKLHLREQCPTEYTWQWTVASVQQINHSCQCVQQNILAVASVFRKIWQLPVCPTKYRTVASVSNKIYWQLPVCPTKYIGSCQCVQQNIQQLPVCSTKYTGSCQCVQQNILAVPSVSNKIYRSCQCVQQNIWQLPVCPTKYIGSCQCVQQNVWQMPVCPTKYMTVTSASNKNTPQCVDSIQQNTPDSEQSPVSNKIYLRQWTVSKCGSK
jgi:hypothetical protein